MDDLHLRVSELAEGRGDASNAVMRHRERRAVKRFIVQRQAIYAAVYRKDDSVYFRRMNADEFRLLDALRSGRPVGEAIDSVFGESELPVEELRAKIEEWFRSWSEAGWLCCPASES